MIPSEEVAAPTGDGGFSAALSAVEHVEGWMSDAQARRLWDRATEIDAPGVIVEIGSYRGRSTIVLAQAAADGVEVVAIDPHAGNDRGPQQWDGTVEEGQSDHDAFNANLAAAGVTDRVRHVRLPSERAFEAVAGNIDALYVDGAHRYVPALADIREWGARLRDGGTMLVHDSFSSVGVTLALLRHCVIGGGWEYVGRDTSLAEYRRRRLTGRERRRDVLRQLAQLPWFMRNLVIKVLILARAWPLVRLLGHRTREWPY